MGSLDALRRAAEEVLYREALAMGLDRDEYAAILNQGAILVQLVR